MDRSLAEAQQSSLRCEAPQATNRINSFSLVSYLPGKLGDFVTSLRQELVSSCVAQSHVTLLPPRPLFLDSMEAEEQIQKLVVPFSPVVLSIPRIGSFAQTSVIFADIGLGREDLIHMHAALNTGHFYFDEPFQYHPHITLAQGIPPETLQQTFELASRRWQEGAPNTSFRVDSLTFVQNTAENRWIDLVECEMRGEAPALAS